MKFSLLAAAVLLTLASTALGLIAVKERPKPMKQQDQSAITQRVRENGLDFALAVDHLWPLPAEGAKPTTISITLTITNKSGAVVNLNQLDTLSINLKDPAGKKLLMDGGRNATRPLAPITLDNDGTAKMDRTGTLQPWKDHPGRYRLIGSEPAGGVWYFDNLAPGKYTLSITYKNERPGPKDNPHWIGSATTKELTVEISQ